MKMIVGLGNPGRKYIGTRHNVGYEIIAKLAEAYGAGRPKSKFHAEIADVMIGGQKVWLVSPLTYMNLSGQAVVPLVQFFDIDLSDLLVVTDDLNLPTGKIRFRRAGSAGGQKGLADIIRRLGTDQFPRLRVGIGRPPEGWDPADYVLGKFRTDERTSIDQSIERAVAGIGVWCSDGIDAAMTQYNPEPASGGEKPRKKRKPIGESGAEKPEKDVDEI